MVNPCASAKERPLASQKHVNAMSSVRFSSKKKVAYFSKRISLGSSSCAIKIKKDRGLAFRLTPMHYLVAKQISFLRVTTLTSLFKLYFAARS